MTTTEQLEKCLSELLSVLQKDLTLFIQPLPYLAFTIFSYNAYHVQQAKTVIQVCNLLLLLRHYYSLCIAMVLLGVISCGSPWSFVVEDHYKISIMVRLLCEVYTNCLTSYSDRQFERATNSICVLGNTEGDMLLLIVTHLIWYHLQGLMCLHEKIRYTGEIMWIM